MKKANSSIRIQIVALILWSLYLPHAQATIPPTTTFEKLKRDTTNWLLENCERSWAELIEIRIPAEIANELDQFETELNQTVAAKTETNIRFRETPLSPIEAKHLTYLTQPFAITVDELRPQEKSHFDSRLKFRLHRNFVAPYFAADRIPIAHHGIHGQIEPILELLAQTDGIAIRSTHRIQKRSSLSPLKSSGFERESILMPQETGGLATWQLSSPDELLTDLEIPRANWFFSTLSIQENGDRLISIVLSNRANRQAAYLLFAFDLLILATFLLIIWKWPYRRKLLLLSLAVYLIIAFIDGFPLWFPSAYPGSPHVLETLPFILLRFGIIIAIAIALFLYPKSGSARLTGFVFVILCSLCLLLKMTAKSSATTNPPVGTSGLFTNVYVVPPTFIPLPSPDEQRPTAQDILEDHGAVVHSAIYNPATSQVIVRADPAQMEIVELIIDQIVKQIHAQLFVRPKIARISPEQLKAPFNYAPGLHSLSPDAAAELENAIPFDPLPGIAMRDRQLGQIVRNDIAIEVQTMLAPDGKSYHFGVKSQSAAEPRSGPTQNLQTNHWIQMKQVAPILFVRDLGNGELELILFGNQWVDPAGLPL